MLPMNILWSYALSLTHMRSHIKTDIHTPHLTVGAMKCWDRVKIMCMGNKGQCSDKMNSEDPPLCRRIIKSYFVLPLAHNNEEITAMFLELRPSFISSKLSKVDIIVTHLCCLFNYFT